MAKTQDEDFVTFLNSAGEVVSNDPRWKAKKLLEEAGIGSNSAETEELNQELDAARSQLQDKDAELAELRRQLELAKSTASQGVEDEDEEDDDAEDEDEFSGLNGKELKARAPGLGVETKGIKTVGELRTALRAAKAAKEAQA